MEDITISNIVFASNASQPLDGALIFKWGERIELSNLLFKDFTWNGVFLYGSNDVNVHHTSFEDASYEKYCGHWGGGLRTRYMNDLTVHHCEFKTTKGGGYGYKGSGHERAKFYENTFHNNVSKGPNDGRPFDFESAHEFEYELEIYNNTFNGMVSIPRGGSQSLTHHGDNTKKFQYSIRIHDNVFYGSGGIEGPRGHLEIDHNYFAQKWNNDGRVYEVHGGANDGPVYIHHNVAECSMGFVFKKDQTDENMFIYNNTVYLINSTRNNFPTSFLEVSGGVNNWQIKNNIIFTQDSPSSGISFSRGSLPTTGIVLSNNVVWQVPSPPSSITKHDPELALSGSKPGDYYTPASASSYVVDQGVDVGLPYEGAAPDIGAYEWTPTTPPSPTTQYTITASAGANGSISPSGSVSVDQGKDRSFTINATSGYQIDDVKVDGASVGAVGTHTIKDVQANRTITASFVATAPTTKPVSKITVSGPTANPTTITSDGGNVQLSAKIEPTDATNKAVTWSIQGNAFGTSLSTSGLLTASGEDNGNGSVTVRATAQDGSGKFGEHQVTISNQASDLVPDNEAPTVVVLTASDPTSFSVTLSWISGNR